MLDEMSRSVERLQGSARARASLWKAFYFALSFGFVASSVPALASPTWVDAPDGAFQGKIDTTGTMREFLGMRYAQPVIGNLRWKAPQPVLPSVATQDATQFGNHCPQTATIAGNASLTEDCLFLNVFTPNGSERDSDGGGTHPVMVWIHGGSLVFSESNEFNPIKLVQRGVVVAIINYRLGALGFLAHSALTGESSDRTSGNYGIEDQQAALKWVRRNIRAFGGNPEKVTLFGESAGGASTLINMASPKARGLFHRAIVESGGYMASQPTLAQAEATGSKFANAVGCNQANPAGVLACLRNQTVSTILANQALLYVGFGPVPNVDGKILTQSFWAALASGQFNRMPLMNGSNHDEGNIFVALDFDLSAGPVTSSTYAAAIGGTISNPAAAPLVATHYQVPAQFPSFDLGVGAVGTDAVFACPARFADELASPFVPTFAYEFNDEKAPQSFLPPVAFSYGATHAAELQYLFQFPNPSGFGLNLPQVPLDVNQQKLSDRMVGYWTEFATSGNPNGHGQPVWPRFHRDHEAMLSLAEPSPTSETNFAKVHQCDFWDTLTGRTLPPNEDHDRRADNH
ncbi:carboxylesterase/lipase family protein [Bradyrhizobium uaiense]|uniref:Carboxylic ester hydrolase n=1 Tax=Bradyrhizobium uaiense TaxID=2594946 RepID=A0A6P1BLU4_9BRAD|nr:carboxylesterase family protein [Bradyrhizobium uaiense]NEU99184.1 carboxylesterase family protein [Bradyrhizobium uaiense]